MLATTKNNHTGTAGVKGVRNTSLSHREVSIKWKLLAICVLLVSIPTVFLGTIGYTIFKYHTQRNTEILMRKIALDWCQVTDSYVKQVDRVLRREEALVKQRLKAIANTSSLILSLAADGIPSVDSQQKQLSLIVDKIAQIDIGRSGYVFIADGKGRCLHSEDKLWLNANISSFLSSENLIPTDNFIEYIKEFSQEESDVFTFATLDPNTGKVRKQLAAVMYFKPWDLIIGALTYYTDFKSHSLEEKLQNELRYRMAEQRIGEAGYIWVVNSRGEYIVSLDRMRDGENILDHRNDKGDYVIQELIEDTKNLEPGGTKVQYYSWQNLQDHEPVKKLAASAYVPEWDWIVSASTYEFDYFRGLERIRLLFIIFCALVILLGSLVGYFFASWLSRPIKSLNQLSLKAAGGEFDVEINNSITERTDELGGLARSFQTMIRNLKILLEEKETFSEELLLKNTELAKAKESLEETLESAERLADKAQEASRAKSTFLATMSHELRTPLSAILGYAQMMLAEDLDESSETRLKIIMQSGEHLLTIISDVLDIAKIEAQVLELEQTEFNFPEFLENIALMVELQAKEKGIGLVREFGPGLPLGVRADEKRLKQILINLLNNAVKFTELGNILLEVKLVTGEDVSGDISRVHFGVEDTGIGIAEEDVQLIFEPFKQVGEGTNLIKGTGLGLPISRQIVEKMGGELGVSSVVNRGSRFSFTLDLEIVDLAPVEKEKTLATTVRHEELYALVVDDIEMNRELFCDMLEFCHVGYREADCGRSALQLVEEQLPDIILLDLNMPDMHGYDVLQELRRTYSPEELRVVIVTGDANPEEEKRCLEAGADGFLTKPFTLDKLQSILHQVDE